MKRGITLIGLMLVFGLTKAQSNREDIAIRWPRSDGWELKRDMIQHS